MTGDTASAAPLAADLSPDQRHAVSIQVRAELAKRCAAKGDVLGWGKAVMPSKFYLPFCQTLHRYFVDVRKEAVTSTEAPRGHSKTTVKATLIPLYQALEEPKEYDVYLNVQKTTPKAVAVNSAIKAELEENPVIRHLYGDQVGERLWTEKAFVLRNGVVFLAAGAGQSIRGLQYRNRRPNYTIVDDLYDEKEIENAEAVQRKNRWFWGSLWQARAKGKRTSFHAQGTAISKEDVLAELAKQPGVKYRQFAAADADGDPLWPELNSRESLEADRTRMGSVIFDREMMNERRDEASAIVKSSWLAGWESDPAKLVFDRNTVLTEALLCVDPSIGKKLTSDATGIALLHKVTVNREHPWWLIAGLWNEHLSRAKRVDKVAEICAAQPEHVRRALRIRVEGIAGFLDFAGDLKTDVRTGRFAVQTVGCVKDKITNLVEKSVHFENGRVFISSMIRKDLRDLALYQITTNRPTHDDLRDAILLGLDAKPSDWRQWV